MKENILRLWHRVRYRFSQKRLDRRSKYASKHDKMMVFGMLSLGRGLSSTFTGMLHDWLLQDKSAAFGGYGSGYGPMIGFTGTLALLGSAPFVVRFLDRPVTRPTPLGMSK